MDELTTFAGLRPDDTLTDDDLAELRAELFAGLHPDVRRDEEDGEAAWPHVIASPRQRRTIAVLVAAAVVAVVGLGGLWALDGRDHRTGPVPATEPGDGTAATTGTDPYAIPLVALGEPGWTVTSAYDNTFARNRAVVLMSGDGLDGPWLDVTATPVDDPTASTVPVGDSTIDVGGIQARVTEIESGAIVRWITNGQLVEAFGWQMSAEEVAAVAPGTTVDGSVITVDVPPGASPADVGLVRALGRFAEYTFTNADGRDVEITFTPGASRGLYQRQGPRSVWANGGRTTISIGGETATVVDDSRGHADPPPGVVTTSTDEPQIAGQYRVDIQRGFWTWEFNATGFESAQQLIDLVAGATVVDAAQWNTLLSDRIVRTDDRAAQLDQLLAGVPLPPGFDRDALVVGGTNDRYQFIVRVSSAVACGWFDEWFAGRDDGDGARMAAAADALATSHEWAMLTEIASEGRWPEAVWQSADLVVDPADPAAVSRTWVSSGLGCGQYG